MPLYARPNRYPHARPARSGAATLPAPDPKLYREIVEHAPVAIIFADTDGVIRIWNAGAEAVFGHPAASALGQSLDLIIPEKLRAAHWRGFREAMASGTLRLAGRAVPTRALHADGRRMYVELSFQLVRDARGEVAGSAACARDITESYLRERGRA